MGNVQGKSLSSCLPLHSITLQTVLLREISTKYSLPKPFSHVLLLAACCPAGKESRRWICPSIAYCGQAGAGSESRAGIPLILPLSTEMQALCFPTLWDFSAHLTDWPPNWTEVLNVINSGNTQEKTAGLSELPSNSF